METISNYIFRYNIIFSFMNTASYVVNIMNGDFSGI